MTRGSDPLRRYRQFTPAEEAQQKVAEAQDLRDAADLIEYLDGRRYQDLALRLQKLADQMGLAPTSGAKPKRRAGIADCLVSADLYGGQVKIHAIRICASKGEALGLLTDYEEGGDSSNHGMFLAEPWIEEHDGGSEIK